MKLKIGCQNTVYVGYANVGIANVDFIKSFRCILVFKTYSEAVH